MNFKTYSEDYTNGIRTSLTTKRAVKLITDNIMTKSTLGRTLGVSPQTIYNYEEEKSTASLTVADKFRDLFLIDITDIGKEDRGLTSKEIQEKINAKLLHLRG